MEIGANLLYFQSRISWRRWLEKKHRTEKEAWLIFPNKSTGKKRLSYNDAVEVALCYGWIDGIVKSHEADHAAQRFTPRRKGSSFSQLNIERLRLMLEKNLVHESVREMAIHVTTKEFDFPRDIIVEIRKHKKAWRNFNSFSPSYRRIRIAYIAGARTRPEEFKKRLRNFIGKTCENILISGSGGTDKYY